MKRRCPHCHEDTIGMGALLRADWRNRPASCGNCGASIRSRGSRSWIGAITGMPSFVLLDPLILILLAIVVATYFDGLSAGAAVVAAIGAGIVLLNLIPLVAPLQVAPAEIQGYRKSKYARLALVRAIFLLLVWVAVIVLAGILIVRAFAALF